MDQLSREHIVALLYDVVGHLCCLGMRNGGDKMGSLAPCPARQLRTSHGQSGRHNLPAAFVFRHCMNMQMLSALLSEVTNDCLATRRCQVQGLKTVPALLLAQAACQSCTHSPSCNVALTWLT